MSERLSFIYRTNAQINELKWWIGELRSGRYEQGTDTLCIESYSSLRYCCLGIAACKVRNCKSPAGTGLQDSEQKLFGLIAPSKGHILDAIGSAKLKADPWTFTQLVKWAENCTNVEALLSQDLFMTLNDTFRWSFNEIADYIEYLLMEVIKEKTD
jgi:hypothetical protein